MRQYVYLRATAKGGGDIRHFADTVGKVIEGAVRQVHPSVVPEGGNGLYWCSHETEILDRRPDAAIDAYAAPFRAVMNAIQHRDRFEVSFVIVTEHRHIDELCGYYLGPAAIATMASLGWDIDIDVVRQLS